MRLAGLLSRSFPCPVLPFPSRPHDPRVAGTERRASGKPTAAETGTERAASSAESGTASRCTAVLRVSTPAETGTQCRSWRRLGARRNGYTAAGSGYRSGGLLRRRTQKRVRSERFFPWDAETGTPCCVRLLPPDTRLPAAETGTRKDWLIARLDAQKRVRVGSRLPAGSLAGAVACRRNGYAGGSGRVLWPHMFASTRFLFDVRIRGPLVSEAPSAGRGGSQKQVRSRPHDPRFGTQK